MALVQAGDEAGGSDAAIGQVELVLVLFIHLEALCPVADPGLVQGEGIALVFTVGDGQHDSVAVRVGVVARQGLAVDAVDRGLQLGVDDLHPQVGQLAPFPEMGRDHGAQIDGRTLVGQAEGGAHVGRRCRRRDHQDHEDEVLERDGHGGQAVAGTADLLRHRSQVWRMASKLMMSSSAERNSTMPEKSCRKPCPASLPKW